MNSALRRMAGTMRKVCSPQHHMAVTANENSISDAAAAVCLQVQFIDCGKPYVADGKIRMDLLSDTLHPNGPGAIAFSPYKKLSRLRSHSCYLPPAIRLGIQMVHLILF